MADQHRKWPALTLMRHTEADLPPVGATDIDRPLTDRGCREARLAGRRLARERLLPDLIIASDSMRTMFTARYLLAGAERRRPVILLPDLYDSGPDTIFEAAAAHADPLAGHVLVLAHNPGIAAAALHLAGSASSGKNDIQEFPPGTMAIFTLHGGNWNRIRPENTSLEQVLYPADYAAASS